MKHDYDDIRSRITCEPKWYDMNGVPRYDVFEPGLCPNIYANQVVLLRIECQECFRPFLVEMHSGAFYSTVCSSNIDFQQRPRELHYGDPPAHGCIGDSMNCIDVEAVEVWNRIRPGVRWSRMPELEGTMNDRDEERDG